MTALSSADAAPRLRPMRFLKFWRYVAVGKHTGLVTVHNERWAFHLFPYRPRDWQWGRGDDWVIETYGWGPLFLIAW